MIVVFDIDGVLADASHREHHLHATPKNWDAFFAEVGKDTVIERGRILLADQPAEYERVLLSGRPERTRAATQAWLREHNIGYSRLLLRRDADRRKAARFKVEIVQELGTPDDVVIIVDDDSAVCAELAMKGYRVDLFA